MRGRVVLAIVIALLLDMGLAMPAGADAPGPTDYRSEVIKVDHGGTPNSTEGNSSEGNSSEGFHIDIVGGDSFVRLQAQPGVEILVVGYRAEPYLRFAPNGAVYENQNSPTKYLNEERYGTDTGPENLGDEPDWKEVAANGEYLWHDHRAHWMNPRKPPGTQPGDTVVEAVVPLQVEGNEVDVHVRSTLLPPPSPLAVLAGASLVLLAGVGVIARTRSTIERNRWLWLVATIVAAGATVVGSWAFWSMPQATGPSLLLWVPAVAAFGALLIGYRTLESRVWFTPVAVALVAAAELAFWVWVRVGVLTRAYLPTDAPFWLDRSVTAASLVAVVLLVVLAVTTGRAQISRLGPGQ